MPVLFRKSTKPAVIALRSDAVFWLTLSLLLIIVPHTPHLPVWLLFFATGTILYSFAWRRRGYPPLRSWVTLPLMVGCVLGVLLYYHRLFGRDAGVALLIAMLLLKLLESKTHRDGMILGGLLYFTVITHFLFNQSIPIALFMFVTVAINTAALISLNRGKIPIAFAQKSRIVAPLMLAALPIMAVLFILFPRIPGPLWGLPQDAYGARSGLSDHMTLGEFSQLALSQEVAYRVKFDGPLPTPEQLYWRTLVLWDFDGRSWRLIEKLPSLSLDSLQISGAPIEYTVTVEPHRQRLLFALDMPIIDERTHSSSGTSIRLADANVLRSRKPVVTLSQYRIRSYPRYQLGLDISPDEKHRALSIPPNINPRSIALAQSWRGKTDKEIIDSALQMFHQSFTYTLRPGALGANPIDEFLFDSKRGFCEHFAGSFAFLMRAAGIPARIVTGYQGGELNPLGDYLIVRQADAHAWVEVWLRDQGWIRIDPTTAVSPQRIEQGANAAIPAIEQSQFLLHYNKIFSRVRFFWDSANNRWNQWVLGYNPEIQRLFLSRLGLNNISAYSMTSLLVVAVAILLGVTVIFSFRQRQRPEKDLLQKAYLKLCGRLEKLGYPRLPHEGPEDFAQRIRRQSPATGNLLQPVLRLYAKLRYSRHACKNPEHLFKRRARRALGRIKTFSR